MFPNQFSLETFRKLITVYNPKNYYEEVKLVAITAT